MKSQIKNITIEASEADLVADNFRIALAVAPAGMIVSDECGKILLVNDKIETMLDYSASEMRDVLMTFFLPALKGPSTGIYFCKRRGDQLFPVELVVTEIQLQGKKFTVISIEDVSERKHKELNLLSLIKTLEKSNQGLENFAYLASHDLQAPMRAIASFAALIKQQLDVSQNPEMADYVKILIKSARDMKALLQALLDYSRVSSVTKLRFSTVDLQELMHNVTEEIFTETGAFNIASKNLPTVSGSPILLKQLFFNLLSNSHKFCKSGTVAQIEITAEELEQEWTFAITDNGIGISQTFLPRVFTIFSQGEDTPRIAGSGMGLVTCRKIIDIHNGKIWCESIRGSGATFYFTIAK